MTMGPEFSRGFAVAGSEWSSGEIDALARLGGGSGGASAWGGGGGVGWAVTRGARGGGISYLGDAVHLGLQNPSTTSTRPRRVDIAKAVCPVQTREDFVRIARSVDRNRSADDAGHGYTVYPSSWSRWSEAVFLCLARDVCRPMVMVA